MIPTPALRRLGTPRRLPGTAPRAWGAFRDLAAVAALPPSLCVAWSSVQVVLRSRSAQSRRGRRRQGLCRGPGSFREEPHRALETPRGARGPTPSRAQGPGATLTVSLESSHPSHCRPGGAGPLPAAFSGEGTPPALGPRADVRLSYPDQAPGGPSPAGPPSPRGARNASPLAEIGYFHDGPLHLARGRRVVGCRGGASCGVPGRTSTGAGGGGAFLSSCRSDTWVSTLLGTLPVRRCVSHLLGPDLLGAGQSLESWLPPGVPAGPPAPRPRASPSRKQVPPYQRPKARCCHLPVQINSALKH